MNMQPCPRCGGETFAVNVVERGMCNACTRDEDRRVAEAVAFDRVSAALRRYLEVVEYQIPQVYAQRDSWCSDLGEDLATLAMNLLSNRDQAVSA
jgi:hypothetical protein